MVIPNTGKSTPTPSQKTEQKNPENPDKLYFILKSIHVQMKA
jgi:hypothetical protein